MDVLQNYRGRGCGCEFLLLLLATAEKNENAAGGNNGACLFVGLLDRPPLLSSCFITPQQVPFPGEMGQKRRAQVPRFEKGRNFVSK